MMRVSSWPARPTNGSPCASSSAPGASPTNTMPLRAEPTPGTVFVRVSHSPHLRQSWISAAAASIRGSDDARIASRSARPRGLYSMTGDSDGGDAATTTGADCGAAGSGLPNRSVSAEDVRAGVVAIGSAGDVMDEATESTVDAPRGWAGVVFLTSTVPPATRGAHAPSPP